jgi:hypothetical protein
MVKVVVEMVLLHLFQEHLLQEQEVVVVVFLVLLLFHLLQIMLLEEQEVAQMVDQVHKMEQQILVEVEVGLLSLIQHLVVVADQV